MELFMQAVMSFLAVTTLGIILCVPGRFLVYSGAAGAIGWTVYIGMQKMNENALFSMFLASFLVALASHLLARHCKAPVTVFLIPGILPLVPGVGVFRIADAMIQENNAMAGSYFVYTVQMAGMIAVAILIVDTIFKIIGRRA